MRVFQAVRRGDTAVLWTTPKGILLRNGEGRVRGVCAESKLMFTRALLLQGKMVLDVESCAGFSACDPDAKLADLLAHPEDGEVAVCEFWQSIELFNPAAWAPSSGTD